MGTTMGTHKQVSTKKSNHCAFQFFSDTQLQKPHPLAVQAFHLWRSANQKPAGLKKWVSGVEQEFVFCGVFCFFCFFYFRGDAQLLIKMTKWDYLWPHYILHIFFFKWLCMFIIRILFPSSTSHNVKALHRYFVHAVSAVLNVAALPLLVQNITV